MGFYDAFSDGCRLLSVTRCPASPSFPSPPFGEGEGGGKGRAEEGKVEAEGKGGKEGKMGVGGRSTTSVRGEERETKGGTKRQNEQCFSPFRDKFCSF